MFYEIMDLTVVFQGFLACVILETYKSSVFLLYELPALSPFYRLVKLQILVSSLNC